VNKKQYEAIAEFRYSIRKFLQFSETAAHAAGITPQQHQVLLAIKGYPGREWATVGELAERLCAGQTAVTNLVGRMEAAGLLERRTNPRDRRSVTVHITGKGEEILSSLSKQHMSELNRLRGQALNFQLPSEEAPA